MLRVEHLKKSYGAVEAIADVSFEVARGRVRVRRRAVGLRQDDAAEVHQRAAGADAVASVAVDGPRDKLALVFQEYSRSLFPWMNVRQNVAFPLRRVKKAEARALVESSLALGRAGGRDRPVPVAALAAACSSAWRSPARSPTSRRSC